jgi:hypothetical protein
MFNIKNFILIFSFIIVSFITCEKKVQNSKIKKTETQEKSKIKLNTKTTENLNQAVNPSNVNNQDASKPSTSRAQVSTGNNLQGAQAKREGAIVTPENNPNEVIDYTAARNINCTDLNCRIPDMCSPDKKTCICSSQNAEFLLNKPLGPGEQRVDPSKVNRFCALERKNQLTYFLLELILNIGAGHFYAVNIGMGVGKIIVVFIPCFVFCIMGCMGAMGGDKIGGMGAGICLAISATCAISIWWLVDVIMIATGKYNDGLGVPLKSW